MKILSTIGYEGKTLDEFIGELKRSGVDMVLDVRAVAASRRPGFSKTALSNALRENGIDYRHFRALGTPAAGREAARKGRTDEMRRMRIARESRGFEASGVRHWGVLAKSAGALFIRSYERGERVHLAMISRGYAGTMPVIDEVTASRAQWSYAFALPFAALVVCLLGWTL